MRKVPRDDAARAGPAVFLLVGSRSLLLTHMMPCNGRGGVGWLQARSEVDARRMRLAKLRGTPGIREERVSEGERDLSDAQQRAEATKAAYEVQR